MRKRESAGDTIISRRDLEEAQSAADIALSAKKALDSGEGFCVAGGVQKTEP